MTDVTETDEGRVRQLWVTLILAALLVVGLFFFVKFGSGSEAANPTIHRIYVIGIVLLAVNYINGNVLLQLVMRVPLPSRLTGGK